MTRCQPFLGKCRGLMRGHSVRVRGHQLGLVSINRLQFVGCFGSWGLVHVARVFCLLFCKNKTRWASSPHAVSCARHGAVIAIEQLCVSARSHPLSVSLFLPVAEVQWSSNTSAPVSSLSLKKFWQSCKRKQMPDVCAVCGVS